MGTKNLELTARELRPMAVISQGLDNQFVPFNILQDIVGKLPRNDARLKETLSRLVRAEYLRSLLYGDQVIINRAYLINTPEINRDFVLSSPFRDTFLELVKNGDIIPWLFNEKTLDDKPAFGLDPEGWKAVQALAAEKDIYRVRLSWDDQENITKTNQLSKTFTSYLMGMRTVAYQIAEDLGIKDKKGFADRLSDVTRFCLDTFDKTGRSVVTRNQLYEKFVCVDNTPITDGIYDKDKPFSLYLKILFDLKYSVNLPDAFGIQAFTGRGLPSRSILHELDMNISGQGEAVTLDIPELLSSLVMGELQQAFWLDRVERINLAQIKKIRDESAEWRKLILASVNLDNQTTQAVETGKVGQPLDFLSFQKAFVDFQNMLAKLFPEEYRVEVQPDFEIQTKIGNVTLAISPLEKTFSMEGSIRQLSQQATPFATSIVAKSKSNSDLGYSFDFMSTKINDARTQAEKLLEKILKLGFSQTNVKNNISDVREGALVDEAEFFGMATNL